MSQKKVDVQKALCHPSNERGCRPFELIGWED
jgi:hypothetical protein